MILLWEPAFTTLLWRDGNGFASNLAHLLGSWVFETTRTEDFSKVSSRECLQPNWVVLFFVFFPSIISLELVALRYSSCWLPLSLTWDTCLNFYYWISVNKTELEILWWMNSEFVSLTGHGFLCVNRLLERDCRWPLHGIFFLTDYCRCELRHEPRFAGVCHYCKGFSNQYLDTEDPVCCFWDPVVMLEWSRMYNKSKQQGVQHSRQRCGKARVGRGMEWG